MLIAFLAMVSTGIFAAHVLDALRTSDYAAGKSQKKCPNSIVADTRRRKWRASSGQHWDRFSGIGAQYENMFAKGASADVPTVIVNVP
jgi:hypothetical protein